MQRRTPRLPAFCVAALLVLAVAACDRGEPPPPLPDPALAPAASPVQPGDPGYEIFPHVADGTPAEALEPDGRMAPWSLAVQVGATLQALAEACGQHDADELARMHDGQRAAMAGHGVDQERWDTVWNWAYRQARQKIALQPAADLARGCASLRDMQEEAERPGGILRPMAL